MKKILMTSFIGLMASAATAAPVDHQYITVDEAELAQTGENAATLQAIFEEAIFPQNWERLRELYADNYVQHNPTMKDGKEGVVELFSNINYETLVYEPFLQLAEGSYVIAASKLQFAPDQPIMMVVDINRIQDGQSREHWDIMAPVEDAEKAFAVSKESSPVEQSVVNANKKRVADMINEVFNQGQVEKLRDYIAEDYVQHGEGEDGIEPVIEDVKTRFQGAEVDIKRIVGSNDLVLAHTRVFSGGQAFARVDIWRVEGGKMSEHWGVMQPIPEQASNANGMF